MKPLTKPASPPKRLKPGDPFPPVRPNVGTEIAFRNAMLEYIDAMHLSVMYWLEAAYKKQAPRIAFDEVPAKALQSALKKLSRRWTKKIEDAAPDLGKYFAQEASKRSDAQLQQILKRAGFSVKLVLSQAQNDILKASIQANVSLIKSIPSKYFTDIEGMVMRSVQTGRDLKQLTDDLESTYKVTRKRAAFIAKDQNNKATSALNRTRQVELGLFEAQWVHSHGDRVPRPTHMAASNEKVRYDTRKGWFDPDANGKGKGAWIFPGELINCSCVSRSIVPGFS